MYVRKQSKSGAGFETGQRTSDGRGNYCPLGSRRGMTYRELALTITEALHVEFAINDFREERGPTG